MTPTRMSSPGMIPLDLMMSWRDSGFFSILRVDQSLRRARNRVRRSIRPAGLAAGIGALHQQDQGLRKRLRVFHSRRLGKLAQTPPELLLVAHDDSARRMFRV